MYSGKNSHFAGQTDSVPYDPPTQSRLARFGAMDNAQVPEPSLSYTAEQLQTLSPEALQAIPAEELIRILQAQAAQLVEIRTQLDYARAREYAATRRLPLAIELDRRARRAARAEQELLSSRIFTDYKDRLLTAMKDSSQRTAFLSPTRLDSAQVSLMWRDLRQQFFRMLELPVPAAGPLDEMDKDQRLQQQKTRLYEIYGRYKTIDVLMESSPGAEVLLSSRSAGYVFMTLFVPSRLEPTWRSAFEMNLDNPKSFTAKTLILLSQQALTLVHTHSKGSPLFIQEVLTSYLLPLKPPYL